MRPAPSAPFAVTIANQIPALPRWMLIQNGLVIRNRTVLFGFRLEPLVHQAAGCLGHAPCAEDAGLDLVSAKRASETSEYSSVQRGAATNLGKFPMRRLLWLLVSQLERGPLIADEACACCNEQ